MLGHVNKEKTAQRRRTLRAYRTRTAVLVRAIIRGEISPEEVVFPPPPRTEGWETY